MVTVGITFTTTLSHVDLRAQKICSETEWERKRRHVRCCGMSVESFCGFESLSLWVEPVTLQTVQNIKFEHQATPRAFSRKEGFFLSFLLILISEGLRRNWLSRFHNVSSLWKFSEKFSETISPWPHPSIHHHPCPSLLFSSVFQRELMRTACHTADAWKEEVATLMDMQPTAVGHEV